MYSHVSPTRNPARRVLGRLNVASMSESMIEIRNLFDNDVVVLEDPQQEETTEGGSKRPLDLSRLDSTALKIHRRNADLLARAKSAETWVGFYEAWGAKRLAQRASARAANLWQELVASNRNLVYRICQPHRLQAIKWSADLPEEYESAGMLGLWQAIHSWDPRYSTLGSWSYRFIVGMVTEAVAQYEHLLSKADFGVRPRVLHCIKELNEKGEECNDEIVALQTKVSISSVKRIRENEKARWRVSIHEVVGRDGDMISGQERLDALLGNRPVADQATDEVLLKEAALMLQSMSTAELFNLIRCTGLDGAPANTFADLAAQLGTSKETTRRTHHRILETITQV